MDRSAVLDRVAATGPHVGACIYMNANGQSQTLAQARSEGYPSVQLLLVEDAPGEVRLSLEAYRYANTAVILHVATHGAEAMAFLRNEGAHHNAPRPDLILLDLNLPKMDGREVLALIKEDSASKTIPTVVLTTSAADEDIVKSYQLHANFYLTKPVEFVEIEGLVESINDFWLKKARLPQQPPNE